MRSHMPASIILLGGPIDTRVNPTAINRFAEQHCGNGWPKCHYSGTVSVPGLPAKRLSRFIELSGFMSTNFDRHITRNQEFFLPHAWRSGLRPKAPRIL